MSTEIQSLNQKIAERVGEQLVDLIPPDQWQAIVDREVTKFQQDTAPQIIREMLSKQFRDDFALRLEGITRSAEWNVATSEYENEVLTKFIAANAGEIFSGMLSAPMQQALLNLRQQLGNY